MSDELREEYDFDYRKAKPNRFAAKLQDGGRMVVLEPEIAAVFQNSQEVNAVLKALLQTMPKQSEKSAKRPAKPERKARSQ